MTSHNVIRTALAREEGSLPLALLAIIVIGTAVATILAVTHGGQRAARFDRDYTTVIQGADAGVEEATNRIVRGQMDELGPWVGGGSTGDTTYEWEATRLDELSWEVVSTGTRNGVARTVRAVVADQPRFPVAAFADTGITFTGGNGASSYGATTWDTGNGIVASNERIKLSGNTEVNGVHLYNWDNNPDFERCDDTGGTGCDDVQTPAEAVLPSARIGPRLAVGVDLDTDFIDEELAECEARDGAITSWTASVDGTPSVDGRVLGVPDTHTVLCFENMTFDANTTIATGGSVEIYLRGRLAVDNGTNVNCASCPDDPQPQPMSSDLTVYSVGDAVDLGNHVDFAAAVYAPHADCGGNGGNAQTSVYGAMICDQISNQGGWQFHYDDRLLTVGSGTYRTRSWQEG